MKKNIRLLKEMVFENLEFIAFAVTLLLLIIDNQIGIKDFQENYYKILSPLLITLTIHLIRESFRRRKQSEKMQTIEDKIDKYLKGVSPKIKFIEPKDVSLWNDIEGVFYGWNPLFIMEQEGTKRKWQNSHKTRYENYKFEKAKYVIFREQIDMDGNDSDEQTPHKRFLEFMGELVKSSDAPEKKTDVFVFDEKTIYTFFIIKKKGSEAVVLYLHEEPFMKGMMPQWAFLIEDQDLVKAFKGMFDEKISRKKASSIKDVLAMNGSCIDV